MKLLNGQEVIQVAGVAALKPRIRRQSGKAASSVQTAFPDQSLSEGNHEASTNSRRLMPARQEGELLEPKLLVGQHDAFAIVREHDAFTIVRQHDAFAIVGEHDSLTNIREHDSFEFG